MKLSAPPPPPPEPPEPDESEKPADGTPAAPTVAPAKKVATWPAWFPRADVVLAVLAVAFAFQLASFTARNSDVWLHLAAGKRLVAGDYQIGSDPFSYTAADRPWVNHAWLFDLLAYALYGGSGAVLVAVKAAAVAIAFALLVGLRRAAFPLWPWAAVAAVAALAASPRLALGPLTGSVVLLAVTLFVLFRVPARPGSWRLPAIIGAIFWVWASVDGWFVLGPVVLLLLLAGEYAQTAYFGTGEAREADPLPTPDAKTLARCLLVGVIAATLTPHHVRVWQVPFELAGDRAAAVDAQLRLALFLTPLDRDYVEKPQRGYNPCGLAYAVLLVGGGVVLGFGVGRLRVSHLLLWLGFAALTLLTVYAIPFFAVVAVPLLAAQLNALSARVTLGSKADPRTRLVLIGSIGGRVVGLGGLVVLMVMAYPGNVQVPGTTPAENRRTAWAVVPDGELEQAARQFQAWREGGRLAADVYGMSTAIELANYCAWFAPAEKVYANGRWNHHRPEWPDYVALRGAVGLETREDAPASSPAVAAVLDRRTAGYVAVVDRTKRNKAAQLLWADPWRWATWYTDGQTTVVGGARSPGPKLDLLRLAFGPDVAPAKEPEVTAVPPSRTWYDDFVGPPRPAPFAADEAVGWLIYKGVAIRTRQNYLGAAAATARRAAVPPPLAGPAALAVLAADENTPVVTEGDIIDSLAAPVLAVRSARRAILANPDHPDGYIALAQAWNDPDLPMPDAERLVGRITAYRQALVRFPAPDEFRRGEYTSSPALVAFQLAVLYAGPVQGNNNKPEFRGIPLAGLFPLDGLAATPVYGPQGPVGVRPFLIPIDLARETLQLAAKYALVEDADAKQPEARAKEFDGLQKLLDDRLRGPNDQWQQAAAKVTKTAERYRLARGLNLVGEAVRLLKEQPDLGKEFGPDAPDVALEMIAMEMVLGRLEDADADIAALRASLDDPSRTGGMDPQQLDKARLLLRGLDLQRMILAGQYAAAETEVVALSGGSIGQFPRGLAPADANAGLLKAYLDRKGAWPATPVIGQEYLPAALVSFAAGLGLASDLEGRRATITQTLQGEAQFFYRRGFLLLLAGDIPGAADKFRKATREPPPGWGLPAIQNVAAARYLRLIELAALPRP